MAAPFYNPFGTANYSRGRGSPMDGDPLSPGARQIVNRVRQGEDAAMRAAANFDPIDDEIKTTNERRTNLRLQREGMKNTLSNFLDTDGADMFERDELTNKPHKNPDGSMIPRLGLEVESLRKQSQQKTGLIAGALSPTKQRGDDTEEAKVAQRRLAEIEPTYKLKQEKYDRIQKEMKRIDDADISHENRLAELGRMREARYTVTPEDVQQAVTQVNTSRAATGQAPVSAKDLSQGKAKTAAPGAYPEGAFATLSDRMTGQPTGRTIAPEAVQKKVQTEAKARNLTPEAVELVELTKLRDEGITHVGGRAIADMIAAGGGDEAVNAIRGLATVENISKRILDIDNALANAGERARPRLEKERAVMEKLRASKAGIIESLPDAGRVIADFFVSFGKGAGSLIKMAGDFYGLASGDMDNAVSRYGKDVGDFYQPFMSDRGRALEAQRSQAVDAEDSELGKAWAYVRESVANPELLPGLLGQNIANMIPAGATGNVARNVAARVLLRRASTDAAKAAAVKTASRIGVGVAVGAGAVMQGTDVAGDQYADLLGRLDAMPDEQAAGIPEIAELLQRGAPMQEAKLALALTQARTTGLISSAISVVAQRLPGGKTIERALSGAENKVGGIVAGAAKGFIGEAASEVVEEVGGQGAKNIGALPVDPDRKFTEGFGETGAQAALVGGVFGGLAGAADRTSTVPVPPAQPPAPGAPGVPAAPVSPATPPAAGATPPAGTTPAAEAEEADVTLDNQAPKSFEFTNAKGETTIVEAVRESQAIAKLPADFGPIKGVKRVERPAEKMEGEKINREWSSFAPESKSLGIPRAEMPQVKAEHRGALTQFLKGRDIISEDTEVLPSELKPTQAEYSPGKVQKAREFKGGDRAILVSSDNHVVDGHHQWMAKLTDAPNEYMRVIKFDAPIRDVLAQMTEFPSVENAGGAAPKPISEQPAAGGVSVAADSGTVAGKPTVPAITTPGGAQSPEAVVRGSDGISEGVPLAPISPEPKTDVADTNTPSAGITPTAPANPLLPPPVAASDKLRAPTAPTPAPGPAAAKPPAIARGTNKPQTFVSTVAKAANLKAKDKATRFLTDFAPRLHKANPQVFEAMEVHILNQAEWDSNPRTGANTPNSAAAYDPETNTMFFNSDKSKGDDVVDNVVHEMGHFAEKFALGEEFTQREWAKLQITQRIQADEQYKGRKLTPEEVRAFGAGIDNKRARSEWATMQFARVVKGDTDGMSTGMRARLEKFLELARELVRKWIGSKSLTTKELDAKILNVLGYAEKADIHTLVGKNSEGHEVYQDERGVRHVARIAANPDLLISEPVGMRPTRGPNGGIVYQADPRTSRERENTEFETTTEKGARTPAPVTTPRVADTTPRVADTTPAVAPKPAKAVVTAEIKPVVTPTPEEAPAVEPKSPEKPEITPAPAPVAEAPTPIVTPTTEGATISATLAADKAVAKMADRKQLKVQKDFLVSALAAAEKAARDEVPMTPEGLVRLEAINAAEKIVNAGPVTTASTAELMGLAKAAGLKKSERAKPPGEIADTLRYHVTRDHGEHVTIEVPGDGTFRIPNSKGALAAFRARVVSRMNKETADLPSPFSDEVKPYAAANPSSIPAVKKSPTKDDLTAAAAIAQSQDETRFILNRVYSEDRLSIGTDGQRMFIVAGGGGETAADIAKLKVKDKRAKDIGKFPNWRQVIPKWVSASSGKVRADGSAAPSKRAIVDTGEAVKALNQVLAIIEKDEAARNATRLYLLDGGKLGFSAASPKIGDYASEGVTDAMLESIDGGAITGANPIFLRDAFVAARLAGHEQVTVYFEDPSVSRNDPFVMIGGSNFAAVTMPTSMKGPARTALTPPPAPAKSGTEKPVDGMLGTPGVSQTDTPAFKAWFGDSKVVDAQGKPMMVYHGTNNRFNVFIGRHRNSANFEEEVGATWFTPDKEMARGYAGGQKDPVAVYVSMTNPYVHDAEGGFWISANFTAIKRARKEGRDGVIIKNVSDISAGQSSRLIDTYITFSPTQIKSATGNRGTFDGTNPDILGTPPVKASPAQEAILAKVNGTLEDKRSIGQRMSDYLADLKDYVSTELKQKLLDSFASIKRLERATFGQGANLDASVSAYKAARLTKNLPSVMDYLMNHGSLEYRNGSMSMKPGAKGLLQIFKPLMDAGTLRLWEGYATAFRSDRLLQEGKETNFGRTQDPVTGQWTWDAATARREIDALLALGKQYPEFEVARQGYVEFQTSILDVAEGAGLIGADQRATWEKSDYVSFYRIAENLEGKGPGKRRGIADQRSGIKKLKGGAAPVAIMENIVRNIESLVDASFKNIAMQRVADLADGNNDMLVKIPYKAVPFKASVTEVLDELEKAGIDTSGLSTDEAAEFVRFWRMKAPKGKDVVSVMVDGKAIYYRVKDAALLRSVQSMGPRVHSWWMSALMAPKNALTALVTLDPEFMVANTIRDSFSAWVISDTPIKPGYDTGIGFLKSLRNDPSKLSVMAAGGGAGHYNNLREGRVRDYIRRLTPAARKTFLESIIDTPKKLGRIYADIGRATENANRLAIADSVKKRGGTDAEAAFQALDIMDFGLRGDSALLGFFLDTVPFLNARMQGLYKLGRASGIGQGDGATKYLPHARIATYGAIITGATLALLGSNWDDERYWELPEWERDIYYHFWLGGQHIRIPKPFEVGQILSTVPERMFEFMGKTGDGKLLAKRMLTMLSETFAMNPLPQVMKPAAERAMNFNTFTGLPIISRGDEFKQPEQQFNVFTSESLREMAEAMPDFAPEWMRSPKTLEHFVRGYFGSLGMYALTASDAITRAATGAPDDPEVKAGDWWVMKRFAPSSDMRETKYVAQFYDMHREITGLTRQIKELQKTAPEEARALQEANAQSLQFASRSDLTYSVLQSLRKQQEQIYASDDTPEGKRRRLAALATRRNQVAKGAVSAAPRTSSMPFNPFAR